MKQHLITLAVRACRSFFFGGCHRNTRGCFTARHLPIFLVSALLSLPVFNPETMAFEYFWSDYSETCTSKIRICHNEKATLLVNLPAEFLDKHKTVTLTATFESNTYTVTQKHKGNSFYTFQPGLRLNDRSFFGNYQIRVDQSESIITVPVELKTKYLKPGENKFTFSYDWRNPKSRCKSSCCGYSIYDIHFAEKPVLKQYSVSILSNPTGALVTIDTEHSSTTPFNVKLTKGYHTITLEKEGYDKFEGKIYIISDREIAYDLDKLAKKD